MAKRRRRRYKWLPTIGTAGPFEGTPASTIQVAEFDVAGTPNGDFLGNIATIIFPLVNDLSQVDRELGTTGVTAEGLGELVGNEYVIERIVGKIWVGLTAPNATSGNNSVIVKAGIFVARADSVSDTVPVGDPTAQNFNYSPLAAANAGEPWMWQRAWILSGPSVDPGGNNPFANAATDNRNNFTNRGTMHEGPHVDCKSVRRVRDDERLFLAVSGMGLEPRNDASTATLATIDVVTDLRVLGALRRAKGGGAF